MPWLSFLHCTTWLPDYSASESLGGDVSAGLTVGVVLIAQGVAYGSLTGMKAYYGLYAALLPPMIYALFGQSRQMNIGPFALISIMVEGAVSPTLFGGEHPCVDIHGTDARCDEYMQACITLSFMVGCGYLVMYVLRLGWTTDLLSDAMMSGLITGASFIICASQLHHFVGFAVPRGNVPAEVWYIASHAGDTNFVSLAGGVLSLVGLLSIASLNKRWKLKFPVPEQLVVVVLATAVCAAFGLGVGSEGCSKRGVNFGCIRILGEVPRGLPAPALPALRHMHKLIPGAVGIGFVSFALSTAVANTFAKKHNYEIQSNQELLAFSVANLVGCCWLAYPAAASLSRSALADAVGAKTPLWNVFAVAVIALTLLFLVGLLKTLPEATLGAVVLMAFKSLAAKLKEPARLWRSSRCDAVIWVSTFLAATLAGVTFAIAIGIMLTGVHAWYTAVTGKIKTEKTIDRGAEIQVSVALRARKSAQRVTALMAGFFTFGMVRNDYSLLVIKHESRLFSEDDSLLFKGWLSFFTMLALIGGPVVGLASDRCSSAFGRRRPFFLVAGILVPACIFVQWAGRLGAGEWRTPGGVAATLYVVAFFAMMFMVNLQSLSLAALVSDQGHQSQRGQTNGILAAWMLAGSLSGYGFYRYAYYGALDQLSQRASSLAIEKLYWFMIVASIVAATVTMVACTEEKGVADKTPWRWTGVCRAYSISLRRHPDFFWVTLSRLLFYAGRSSQTYLVYFFRDFGASHGKEHRQTTLNVLFLSQAIALPVAVVAGWRSDVTGRKPFIYSGSIGMAVAYIALALSQDADVAVGAMCVFGAMEGLYLAVEYAIAIDTLPSPSNAAQYLGFWSFSAFFGTGVGTGLTNAALQTLVTRSDAGPASSTGICITSLPFFHTTCGVELSSLDYSVVFSIGAGWFLLSALTVRLGVAGEPGLSGAAARSATNLQSGLFDPLMKS